MSRSFKRDTRPIIPGDWSGPRKYVKVPDSDAGQPAPRDNPKRRNGVDGKLLFGVVPGAKRDRARLERRIMRNFLDNPET